MKKVLLFSFAAILLLPGLQAQVCNATSFDVDLSASIDTTVSFQSTRNGDCCTGTNCIRFNLTLNPACSYVNFTVANPAPPGNSAYYQIDCGTPTSLGTPICIVGKTNVVITFCKPGNDNPIYTITAAGALKGSDDITVREGCTGSMNVSGLQTATINWTSIYPGVQGAYNSWLNCTAGCTTVNVTPQVGAPAYVDYKVSGYRLCGPLVSDTIRVYTTPQIAVSISPDNPSVCAGGSSFVTLTATASGGDAPYNFLWNTGETGTAITVNTGNNYSVSVTDSRNCLPATQSVVVKTTPLPTAPTITSNSPVCAGSSLQLNASSIAGATYSWTGPNGFTSNLQNPSISNVSSVNAGSYSVTVTVGQCTSIAATTSVVVNAIPASPIASNNSPVCEGGSFGLTASSVVGAVYNWSGPSGYVSTTQNPVLNSVSLLNAGSYSVTATVNGCTSAAASTAVVINPLPSAPGISVNSSVCAGSSLVLSASSINNASYSWTGPNGFTSSIQNPVITNATAQLTGTYSVKATVNGCTGPSSSVQAVVNSIPPPPSLSSNQPICEGSDLNFTASAGNGSTYTWTGPNGFGSSVQNPVLPAASLSAAGTYSAFVTVNGCNSPVSNISVMVKPVPSIPVISGNNTVCEGTSISLSASSSPAANYSWNGPNGFTSNLQSINIGNSTSANSGTFSVIATLNGCASAPATTNVLVNSLPIAPAIQSNAPVCEGNPISLTASSIPGAQYSWTGPNGFVSNLQSPVIATTSLLNSGTYQLNVKLSGCQSAIPSSATILVKPVPSAPSLSGNSPLCAGSDLILSAAGVAGASYNWTGPNGFSSALQNNTVSSVTNLQAGNYYVTATLNGCTSLAGVYTVIIDQPAKVNAGTDQSVCMRTSSINLNASNSGGKNTGIWTSSGSGSFSNAGSVATEYYPSTDDRTSGTINLIFTSTNNGSCPASSSATAIRFSPAPSAYAGKDQTVCANNANVTLSAQYSNASGGIWSSSGTGNFLPSANDPFANYVPSTKDKADANINLTWTTVGNGPCPAATDVVLLSIKQPPFISTGGILYVLENNSVVLNPVITGNHLSYSWTPAIFLNSDTIANPLCTPKSSVVYELFAKDEFGCSSSGDITVKLIRPPVIPNVFTPNGDGINDTWQIKNLSDYNNCVMELYNRYGQVVYRGTGYDKEWDGTSKGKALPAGTYYYIIDLKTGAKPLSGFVDIVR